MLHVVNLLITARLLQLPMIQINHNFLNKILIDPILRNQILILQQLRTQINHLLRLHNLYQVHLKRITMLLVTKNVTLTTLHLRQNLISINLQRTVTLYLSDLVTIDLVLNHHLNHPLRIIHDLLQCHVHLDLLQSLILVVNLLNVLQVSHYTVVMNRKRNVLNIDQNLLQRSIRPTTTNPDLLHYRSYQHLVHTLRQHMELHLLVVQLIQNTLQITHCRLLRRKVIVKTVVETLLTILNHLLIKRTNLLQNKTILLVFLTLKVTFEKLTLLYLEKILQLVLLVEILKCHEKEKIKRELTPQMRRIQLVVFLNMENQTVQLLI